MDIDFIKLHRYVGAASFDQAVKYIRQSAGLPNEEDLEKVIVALAPSYVEELQLRASAALAFDAWGRYEQARSVIKEIGEGCRRQIDKRLETRPAPIPDHERNLLRWQVRVLLQLGMSEYRYEEHDKARLMFLACDKICRNHIGFAGQNRDLHAAVIYSLGLTYREKVETLAALKCFSESLELSYKAEREPHLPLNSIARAKTLSLGKAFCYLDLGRPDIALPLLVAAKTILQSSRDKLVSAYVDLIYANVLRIKGGSAASTDEAISVLRRSHETFAAENHGQYRARAAYYLAVAYVHRARPDEDVSLTERGRRDLDQADHLANELEEYFERPGGKRFKDYRLVLKSRIERKRDAFDLAEELATGVLQSEPSQVRDGVLLNALLARAKARERTGNLVGAGEDFKQALESTKNERNKAVCLLHLCRISALQGNNREATRCFVQFEEIKDSVTHGQIPVLERRARAAMEQGSKDLILRITDENIDFATVEQRMRRFLVEWAKSRATTETQAATLIGVSRQTLFNWSKA
jgi:tetratricopeptide (TPR) repeat protein